MTTDDNEMFTCTLRELTTSLKEVMQESLARIEAQQAEFQAKVRAETLAYVEAIKEGMDQLQIELSDALRGRGKYRRPPESGEQWKAARD